MKKILAVGLLASSLLMAEVITKAEQIVTMQKLESAMEMIQKGFFRDNAEFVKYGSQGLKEGLTNVNSFMIDESKVGFDAKQYVANEVKLMNMLVDDIIFEFEHGNKVQARFLFDRTLSRCMACHKTVRK
jgi:hypothetical protein